MTNTKDSAISQYNKDLANAHIKVLASLPNQDQEEDSPLSRSPLLTKIKSTIIHVTLATANTINHNF